MGLSPRDLELVSVRYEKMQTLYEKELLPDVFAEDWINPDGKTSHFLWLNRKSLSINPAYFWEEC